MKVSIITAAYNSENTIRDTIESVLSQTYCDIEYIIVDGQSKDETLNIIKSYGNKIDICISEKDQGMYDAMNKGISLATGDLIGILNSDDFYSDDQIISTVVQEMQSTQTDCIFGDLVYVKPNDLNKVIRYYSSEKFEPKLFARGWMPAHPTVFIKRSAYEKYGLFKTDYEIAADYELLTRFLGKNKLPYHYIPKVMVIMRTGGVSTSNLKSNWILNREIVRSCRENGIQTNLVIVFTKYFSKVLQLYHRPKSRRNS